MPMRDLFAGENCDWVLNLNHRQFD